MLLTLRGFPQKLNVTAKVFTALRTAPLNEGRSYLLSFIRPILFLMYESIWLTIIDFAALSQLKLLQTKPEDGVDLQTPSSQPEHGKNLPVLKTSIIPKIIELIPFIALLSWCFI